MNDNEINDMINTSAELLLLYFHHDACAPCKAFKPTVNKIVGKFNGRVKIISVDVTESNLGQYYSVQSVPTFALVKQGVTYEIHSGSMSEDPLTKLIQEYV